MHLPRFVGEIERVREREKGRRGIKYGIVDIEYWIEIIRVQEKYV